MLAVLIAVIGVLGTLTGVFLGWKLQAGTSREDRRARIRHEKYERLYAAAATLCDFLVGWQPPPPAISVRVEPPGLTMAEAEFDSAQVVVDLFGSNPMKAATARFTAAATKLKPMTAQYFVHYKNAQLHAQAPPALSADILGLRAELADALGAMADAVRAEF